MTWSTVRNFGRVKYFNVSYVVLIVVPILLELHHKAAATSKSFANAVAFPVTLRWLYAASLCYALAIALYQYFCPSVVKNYENMEDYIGKNHELFLRAHPHHRLSIVISHLDPELDEGSKNTIQQLLEKRDTLVGSDRTKAEEELNVLLTELHPDAIQRFLVTNWALQNAQFPPALWTSFTLYLFGTIIIVVLLIMRSFHLLYPF